MNFWTGLILGIIIGWLVEWIIDWLFWRREPGVAPDEALLRSSIAAERDADWQEQLAAAEGEYHTRLAAVEAEWRARLELNEQQWQAQFAAIEADRAAQRVELSDAAAVATLAAAGAVAVDAWDENAPDADVADHVSAGDELGAAAVEHVAADEFPPPPADAFAGEAAGAVAFDTRGPAVDLFAPPVGDVAIATPVADYPEPDRLAPRGDDLTRIRGIGPRYAALLADSGIHTFDDLAAADAAQLRAIINPGPMHQLNFTSWAAQASAFAATREARTGDDLTTLEGIGPMYAARLNDAGITTFAQLAEADEATLAAVINAPAWRRINYGNWQAQARLAADGDEAGLRELQAHLFRREGDNLSLIRGIGTRSAAGLREAGLGTFAALAAATPEQVEAAVKAGGGRGGDYAAWIGEAGQRAAGRRVARATRRPRAVYVVPCPQDLSAVHGIGSVFEQRLYAAGIGSYWELAELPADELATILDVRPGSIDLPAIQAEAMRLAVAGNALGSAWDGTPPDDFEQVGGIGEVFERRLYEAGICTFAALAATPPERLAEICQSPALRLADYAAWSAHAAELAAARSA
jgi:predicted flap endonuclease-1-like 5' DNA nuclease